MHVELTINSNISILNGRVKVTVAICFQPFFSRSKGAKILGFWVLLRRSAARFESRTGP